MFPAPAECTYFGNWVKTREGVALLTAKLQLFLPQTIACLRSSLFSALEVKQRGYTPSKQVHYVQFFKLFFERGDVKPRTLQLFGVHKDDRTINGAPKM